MQISLEMKLLLSAVNAEVVGIEKSYFDIKLKETNVEKILSLACIHGVVRQVALYCKFHQVFTEQEQNELHQAGMFMAFKATAHEQQLLRLTTALEGSDIHYALMKGSVIQHQFGAPKLTDPFRISTDIDLLVQSHQLPETVKFLEDFTYKAKSQHVVELADFVKQYPTWTKYRDIGFTAKDELAIDVDLHWQATHLFSLPLKTQEVFDRLEDVNINHKSIKTLSFNDHFLLICIHGYLDQFFILKYLVDIFWAINHPDFELDSVLFHAEKYGVKRHIEESIETAQYFFRDSLLDEDVNKKSPYVKAVLKRFVDYQGQPPRMFQEEFEPWSIKKKLCYVLHQIKTRSRRVAWWHPLIHHFKYDERMILAKKNTHPAAIGWPIAYLLKWVKR